MKPANIYNLPIYIDIVPNRKSKPAVLLRESWRDGKRIRKRTVGNLSSLPDEQIDTIRRILKGEILVSLEDLFSIEKSTPHGHVAAVLGTMRKLKFDRLLGSDCPERNLVMAAIAARILHPGSKLSTVRLWSTNTLGEELDVTQANEKDLYLAMDWLLKRQARIETRLAKRHLSEGGTALYDLSSSYFEGATCPLACFGHNRDKKKGKPIVVYGLLTDGEGCPVAVQVYEGNRSDTKTVMDQVDKLRSQFGFERIILVGDRGMITQTRIDEVRKAKLKGLDWVSALRTEAIRKLFKGGIIQMSLFDEKNLAEISVPDFPGERLVVCRNPLLQRERKHHREALLQATEKKLDRIRKSVLGGKLQGKDRAAIALAVGKVVNHFKVSKHYKLDIADGAFSYERDAKKIAMEAALDGLYVIRTSVQAQDMDAGDVVRTYKNLSQVEHAFRTFKSMELKVRPIFHRLEDRVRAHILICMLAYYVEWHMRKALAPMLFSDEELEKDRWLRNPVAQAELSKSAKGKKKNKRTGDGQVVHSFQTLMTELGTVCRNRCRIKSKTGSQVVNQVTQLDVTQKKAFGLLGVYP